MQMTLDTRAERLARGQVVHRKNSIPSASSEGYAIPTILVERNKLYEKMYDLEENDRPDRVFTPCEMMVVWALLFKFPNNKTGMCFPSYDELCAKSGRSRQVVANAVRKADALGFIKKIRRRKLLVVKFGRGMSSSALVQDSNLYVPQPDAVAKPDAVLAAMARNRKPVRSNLPALRPRQLLLSESICQTVTRREDKTKTSPALILAVDNPIAKRVGRFSEGLGREKAGPYFGLINIGIPEREERCTFEDISRNSRQLPPHIPRPS